MDNYNYQEKTEIITPLNVNASIVGSLPNQNEGNILQESATWCWFSYPQAVKYDNYTFFGYVNPIGEVWVARYDHTAKTTTTIKLNTFEVDDHNAPAIIKLASGKIAVFYCRHAADNVLRYRISTSVDGIDFPAGGEQTLTSPGGMVSYAQVHRLITTNKILWFYRTGNTDKWACVVSSDDGVTWSAEKIVFNFPVQGYIKTSLRDVSGNVILVTLSTHPDRDSSDHNIYAVYIKDNLDIIGTAMTGPPTFGNIDTGLNLPISISMLDKVYDWTISGEKAWIWDCASFITGETTIAFATLPSQYLHRYKCAYLTSTGWVVANLLDDAGGTISDSREPSYSGGLSLSHEYTHRGRLYLSRYKDGKWTIEEWRTTNNGSTWFSKYIASEDNFKLVRPLCVINGSIDLPVMWLSGAYTWYSGEYLTDVKYLT